MKLVFHVPLFIIILALYNLALFIKRDDFKAAAATPPAVQQAAPAAPAAPAEAAAPAAAEPGAAEPQPAAATAVETAAPTAEKTAKDWVHPLDKALFSVPLPSRAVLPVSTHEFLLILAVVFLYVELFKSTKTGTSTIVEHVFSLLVFMAFFIQLIMFQPAGTPVFLILTLMAFLDVIAGFTITISTARRDFGMGTHGGEGG